MNQLIKNHGRAYLMEAAGIAGFVIGAGLLVITLEHPNLWIMHGVLKDYPLLRRIILGVIMGIYVAGITLLFGKKSGSQVNPAVTWSYYRLGKIKFMDALYYTIAQFIGAIAGAQLLKYTTAGLFGHPLIDFGVTKPKPPHGSVMAFTAEFIISFILLLVLLFTSSSKRLEKYVALISGLLLGSYLIFEEPFSGMSLNPARSFAGALAANEWAHLWIYFVAPVFAMFIAAEIFLKWRKKQLVEKNNDYLEISNYPIEI